MVARLSRPVSLAPRTSPTRSRHSRRKAQSAGEHPVRSAFELDDGEAAMMHNGDDVFGPSGGRAGSYANSAASSQRIYRPRFIPGPPPSHAVTATASDVPSSDGHIYFTFQECHESASTNTNPRAVYLEQQSTRDSYEMDDYRSSSLFRGDSSYAPPSSAYFNSPSAVSPAPSSAVDSDGRFVFKRQCLRETLPETESSLDIWHWVRGVERRRTTTDVSTPNSFVEEYGSLRDQQPTSDSDSYLHSSVDHDNYSSSPMPCPLPDRMVADVEYMEDDFSYAYPSRCSSTTLEHVQSVPARPAAVDDPGMHSFLSWLADDEDSTSKLPPRFQISPPVATVYRCYDEDCPCPSCASQRSSDSDRSGFRPPSLEIRQGPMSSYTGEMDDGYVDEMWSPPSLHSSSSSPPYRPHSVTPSEMRAMLEEQGEFQSEDLQHPTSPTRPYRPYTPVFLSFSPFSAWNNKTPDVSSRSSSMDSLASTSFSHIPLHQPQPVRPIVLIREPLLQSFDEQMCGDTETDVKFPFRSKAQVIRTEWNSNLITSIA